MFARLAVNYQQSRRGRYDYEYNNNKAILQKTLPIILEKLNCQERWNQYEVGLGNKLMHHYQDIKIMSHIIKI